MRPSFQISGRRQSGHQRRPAAGTALLAPPSFGAYSATSNAVTRTGIDQTTKFSRQLSCTSGRTSGMVSPAARISPIRRPGRIDRSGKADALRKPGPHQGRQRRLHDRDARRHHDGRCIEEGGTGKRRARGRAGGIEQQAHDQRRHDAEASDQHRARHGGDRKQHRRQARQPADARLRQMQVGVQQRHDRRHRQDGEPQTRAGEP